MLEIRRKRGLKEGIEEVDEMIIFKNNLVCFYFCVRILREDLF